uniref:Ig-like domain-containing protein n=1 Tax=Astyanax mexicanus TaxID=7994 RepID=A0A3B1IQN2_ASTMX
NLLLTLLYNICKILYTQTQLTDVSKTEGKSVTLKCSYETSSEYVYLYWYRQYPNRALQYLLRRGRLDAEVNETDNKVDLEISSTAVSDSALYYCALQPTVTETHQTLY